MLLSPREHRWAGRSGGFLANWRRRWEAVWAPGWGSAVPVIHGMAAPEGRSDFKTPSPVFPILGRFLHGCWNKLIEVCALPLFYLTHW